MRASHTSTGENWVADSTMCRQVEPSPAWWPPWPTGCGEPSAQGSPVASRVPPPHQTADVAARGGRHRVGHGRGDGLIDRFDRLSRGPAHEEARRGRNRVEERARPGDDLDRPEVTLVRRFRGAGQHADRDAAPGYRHRQRAVDRSGLGAGRVRIVDPYGRAVDLDGCYLEGHRVGGDSVVVHLPAADVTPVGDTLEIAPHHGLAMVVHVLDRGREALEAEALDHAHQLRGAGAHAGHLGVDVARHPSWAGGCWRAPYGTDRRRVRRAGRA